MIYQPIGNQTNHYTTGVLGNNEVHLYKELEMKGKKSLKNYLVYHIRFWQILCIQNILDMALYHFQQYFSYMSFEEVGFIGGGD